MVYTTQEGIRKIKNILQIYTTQESIREIKNNNNNNNNKFKFIPRSFYKNIQLRLTINIKLEIKIEVQNYNSKIMQFNYKNYRTN